MAYHCSWLRVAELESAIQRIFAIVRFGKLARYPLMPPDLFVRYKINNVCLAREWRISPTAVFRHRFNSEKYSDVPSFDCLELLQFALFNYEGT
jgi:hypothetical protein